MGVLDYSLSLVKINDNEEHMPTAEACLTGTHEPISPVRVDGRALCSYRLSESSASDSHEPSDLRTIKTGRDGHCA